MEVTGSFSPPALVENGAPNGFKLYDTNGRLFLYAAAPDGGPSYINRAVQYGLPAENDDQRFSILGEQLFAGGDPALLLAEMQALRQRLTLDPAQLYLYGLTAELAGQTDEAVIAYWQIWDQFPDNFFAFLARFSWSAILRGQGFP